ncbi:transposase [Streptomyces sp. x-80]|uniref:transposase n=1 Tax=Streptomyces sp. x-80 TaxID=2789282 RepID=UPI003980A1AD
MPPRYTQQFKDEAVRMVIEGPRPIARVAAELGIYKTTLGNWVARYHASLADTAQVASCEPKADRERQLERENQKLREENAFLTRVAAFFAREYR